MNYTDLAGLLYGKRTLQQPFSRRLGITASVQNLCEECPGWTSWQELNTFLKIFISFKNSIFFWEEERNREQRREGREKREKERYSFPCTILILKVCICQAGQDRSQKPETWEPSSCAWVITFSLQGCDLAELGAEPGLDSSPGVQCAHFHDFNCCTKFGPPGMKIKVKEACIFKLYAEGFKHFIQDNQSGKLCSTTNAWQIVWENSVHK